jgi:TolB-like protein/DNA-binding winged helix-turn-helix (wHTH) protein/Flp pilus assembly protein TadD
MSTDEKFYRFDDVTVDGENFRVQKDGQNITLTPRAFDVLLVLIKNGGRVIEKQEIFDKVWKETFVGDNALTKIIKEIRHALNDDANNPRYIETVPKRGYRIIAEIKQNDSLNRIESAKQPTEKFVVEASQETIPQLKAQEVQPTKRKNLRLAGVIVLGLLILAFGFFVFNRQHSVTVANDRPIDSIAVLPFENAAQDPSVEYLSDGITESLINRLSQLSNLKVMSRSSVFRYKGKEQDAQKVGTELTVRAVLTGSVKQIGDQLVITVRLDDAQTNQHIWGEQYVRKFADILNVQSEIAQDVSTNLRVKLTSEAKQQLAKRYTDNVEAYQLYLKGQYEWNKFTQEDLQKSIEYYDQALEKDANYALAYAGLSKSYIVLGTTYLPPNEAFPKAKAYAAKALEIDDTLAEAHVVMGAVRLLHDWNWAEAERELKRAQALNPNHPDAHNLYGYYLKAMGRLDEAKAETKRAQEFDPLSLMINSDVGVDSYYARQYDEAIAQNEKTINLEPHFFIAYLWLGQAYEQKKMYAEAITTFQKGMALAERHPQLIASLGRAYALAGEREKAQKSLDELREISKRRYVSPYLFAVVYAGLGDKDQAFTWLEKAYEERTFFLIWLKVEPRFDSLRDDPRYKDLLRRIGLQP